jgi:hypothetical protein
MSEKEIYFRDIRKAEATKKKNTEDITERIKENKRITSNKEIQTQLLKEFLETRKTDPKIQEMIKIFKWKREQEKKSGTTFDIPRLSVNNVIAQIETLIQKGETFDI